MSTLNSTAMTSLGGKEPLLTGQKEPKPHIDHMGSSKSRKLRRCKSAPMAESAPEDDMGDHSKGGLISTFEQLNPRFGKVAFYLFAYLGLSTLCFYLVRDQIAGDRTLGVVDSLYFCIVTMTTVGYGDLLPNSTATKLLACAFVFSGMALVGLSLSKAADSLVENQEILLVKALHLRQKAGSKELLKETETHRVYHFFCIARGPHNLRNDLLNHNRENGCYRCLLLCVTTMTTLGYGDKSFSTTGGRIFAIFWILFSTICLAQVLFAFAELYTESRQRSLVSWVLTRKTTAADLEAADLDDDGEVVGAEFVIYKLKEMGKITQEDIELVMTQFEKLDEDDSGTLSITDISIAQSKE
ncbi:hypothetical protein OSB04_007913 [Centaurea solstitialis]|uniref:Potassium channel domain-containing protein n=1 Tax=Centaurea solstitialis TaxID=347529 RepID=A0AA38TKS1_9ASTR|nr:hypothetical protein OSB04_007913 [Centaurea solstitialis]